MNLPDTYFHLNWLSMLRFVPPAKKNKSLDTEGVPASKEDKQADYTVEITMDAVGMIHLRAELGMPQPFDVLRSLRSIDRRIGDCIRTRNFTRAARLQEMYQALQFVQRKQKALEHDV